MCTMWCQPASHTQDLMSILAGTMYMSGTFTFKAAIDVGVQLACAYSAWLLQPPFTNTGPVQFKKGCGCKTNATNSDQRLVVLGSKFRGRCRATLCETARLHPCAFCDVGVYEVHNIKYASGWALKTCWPLQLVKCPSMVICSRGKHIWCGFRHLHAQLFKTPQNQPALARHPRHKMRVPLCVLLTSSQSIIVGIPF